jgi:hypothetical protein
MFLCLYSCNLTNIPLKNMINLSTSTLSSIHSWSFELFCPCSKRVGKLEDIYEGVHSLVICGSSDNGHQTGHSVIPVILHSVTKTEAIEGT